MSTGIFNSGRILVTVEGNSVSSGTLIAPATASTTDTGIPDSLDSFFILRSFTLTVLRTSLIKIDKGNFNSLPSIRKDTC